MKLQWEVVDYQHKGRTLLVEVIPTEGHEESNECHCGPTLMQNCRECSDTGVDCWRCGGRGLVEYSEWGDEVPVVVHNDPRLT